ncbi:YKOF-related family domain protein [Kockovaella imperatae]|uniref:YKOF-related family domain protein n=1 Tax=Kockovaella imperatae TaxID=4999 RepID=A0A1Y1U847_9TREE|nr:YKOF-related family domain protein [Kockovaella imperatae]ORX34210.1 YKOF-related family domain protein [Kockovaella imperatae]
MYCGAQVTLSVMSDDYVAVILGALSSLDPYRKDLRMETDDTSTLMIGPPDILFAAMRDLFTLVVKSGHHVTMHALVSRGCPGGPQLPETRSEPGSTPPPLPLSTRKQNALVAVETASETGQIISAQFAYYPLGQPPGYMTEINACIDFIDESGTLDRKKNFCTKLRGDGAKVFKTLEGVFVSFAPDDAHITLDLMLSANSPTARDK